MKLSAELKRELKVKGKFTIAIEALALIGTVSIAYVAICMIVAIA